MKSQIIEQLGTVQLEDRVEPTSFMDADNMLRHVEDMVGIDGLSGEQKQRVIRCVEGDYGAIIKGENTNHPFGVVRNVWDAMAEITSAPHWDEGRFSTEQTAAQKLYAAVLFETILDRELQGEMTESEAVGVYEAYFSSSDLITDYTGGYASELELYALSRRSETGRRLAGSIRAGLAYNGAFSDIRPSVEEAWQSQQSPAAQLNFLSMTEDLLQESEETGYSDGIMTRALYRALSDISNHPKTTALAGVVAGAAIERSKERTGTEWIWLDELPAEEQQKLIDLDSRRRAEHKEEQRRLHESFPQLPSDALLQRVASDACAVVEQGTLGRLVTATGLETDLHRPEMNNSLGLSENENRLIVAAHDATILDTVRLESGIDLSEASLSVQVRFFAFMAEANTERYHRLCQASMAFPEQRSVFLEAFLATEFGDDLGDIVLNLAERNGEDAMPMFEALTSIRADGEKIAKHFGHEDDMDSMVATAFIKRATELLALAESEGVGETWEAMHELQEIVHEIAEAVDGDEFKIIEATTDYGTLQAARRPVTITARPSGSNARLGMTVRGRGADKKQRVNIRLDYEDGRLSLDIGSIARNGVNNSAMARQLGEALAKGELALANRRAKDAIKNGTNEQRITLHGNHVREAFEPIGDVMPAQFSRYVNNFLYSLNLIDDSIEQQKAA